jgi:tRNA (guanine37-N1)-methyltransferase
MFKAKILTLFPEAFPGLLELSITGKALANKTVQIEVINIRDYAKDQRKTVDDAPFGGGHGMLIKADVLGDAIESNMDNVEKIFYLSPRGRVFNQVKAKQISQFNTIMLICGRYEGIDQRVIDYFNIEEISIGDYILTGGELAAQVILDSVFRLLPGVLGGQDPHSQESFATEGKFKGLVEYHQYTKPRIWKNIEVPEILLSGNHEKIYQHRLEQAIAVTNKRNNSNKG